jgi:hypothetical protein
MAAFLQGQIKQLTGAVVREDIPAAQRRAASSKRKAKKAPARSRPKKAAAKKSRPKKASAKKAKKAGGRKKATARKR